MDDVGLGAPGRDLTEPGPSRPRLPRVLAALFGFALLNGYVIWRSAPLKVLKEAPGSVGLDRESEFRDLLFADQPAPPDLGSDALASLAYELTLIAGGYRFQRFRPLPITSKTVQLDFYSPLEAVERLRGEIAARIRKGDPLCQLPPCPMPPDQARDPGMPLPRPTPTLPPDDLLFDQAIQIARGAGFLFGDLAPQANPVIDPTQPLGDPAAP